MSSRIGWLVLGLLGVPLMVGLGCNGPRATNSSEPLTVRLGFFLNLTHATALVGVDTGIFARQLPPNVAL